MGWVAYPYTLALRRYAQMSVPVSQALGHGRDILRAFARQASYTWSTSRNIQYMAHRYTLAGVPNFQFEVRLPWITWPGLGRRQRRFRSDSSDSGSIIGGGLPRGTVDSNGFKLRPGVAGVIREWSATPDKDGVFRLGRDQDIWLPGFVLADIAGYQGFATYLNNLWVWA